MKILNIAKFPDCPQDTIYNTVIDQRQSKK